MTAELVVLALAGLVAAGQLCLLSAAANLTMPTDWLVGPRDQPHEVPRMAGRLMRAWNNMLESLILFTAAVLVVELSGRNSAVTATAAQVYLAARVLYVPAYALGLPWVRTVIWAFGFFATVAMLIAALLG